nr:gephyrin-like molybdotransferase Glp [Pseudoxanthomonas sp.]
MHAEIPGRIAIDEALAIIRAVAAERAPAPERIALRRAEGRILAEDIIAPIALPPFDNSWMDGFALRHADLAACPWPPRMRIAGAQYAGMDPGRPLESGCCVRITTGAALPAGADTVVIKEDVREDDGWIELGHLPEPGADIRRAGEDVMAGERLLGAGQVLTPARVSLLAALGIAGIAVAPRPTVAVFTTGDELVEPGMPLPPGRIYNSNRDLLMGLLRQHGLEPTAWPTLPDETERIRNQLEDAAAAFDLVLTCGGVSAGEKDFLPDFLAAHGKVHFWKVRMKPGMPVLFGQRERALFLSLPGNPVSVLATFLALGVPLLDGLQGRREPRLRWHARLAGPWRKTHGRHEFLRGRLQPGADGIVRVAPNAADASHRLRGAAESDALIVLPEGERAYAADEVVEILPY